MTTNNLQQIQQKIYEIRGQRVMLDRDLAALYGVETRRLNEQVKRNIERFPEDFMFQLTKGELEILRANICDDSARIKNGTHNRTENEEFDNWISQIATSKYSKMGLRRLPYAFTENGVAMLSSVLRSPLAIQVNIGIMRVFTEIRRLSTAFHTHDSNAELRAEIQTLREEMEDILADQNDINEETRAQLDAISMALAELQCERQRPTKSNPIGFVKPKETD